MLEVVKRGKIGALKIDPASRKRPGSWPNLDRRSDMPSLPPSSKRCSKCGETKPSSKFHKNACKSDGLQNQCKTCRMSKSARRKRLLARQGLRQCAICKKTKPRNEFYKDKSKSTGRSSYCIPCDKKQSRQYRRDNRDILLKKHRQYYQENRDDRLEYQRKYCEENRQEVRRKNRRHYWANREDRLEYHRRHYRQNRNMYRNYGLQRRALENNADGYCTPEQLEERIEYYGGLCYMCGAPYEAIDHVIALSKGGSNWPANLRPACRDCNTRKLNRDWRLFVE